MAESKNPGEFEMGLVMAGAISGGAYAAGVVDFLIEALDCWEEAKQRDPKTVPHHRLKLRVMSGASAGAMVSAIAAIALSCETEPVADIRKPPPPGRNHLFDAWVRQIDITKLLDRKDLDQHKKVMSLLDSTALTEIALSALQSTPRTTPRPYVADPLAVFLTVANLRGVPYGFDLFGEAGETSYGMLRHMDDMRFAVSPTGKDVEGARRLDPAVLPSDPWPQLANAALASGAFPVGLQPRLLERPSADFDIDDYQVRFGGKPMWGIPSQPVEPYRFLCVDGGLMNNEPLEMARRYLARSPEGRNPRHGEEANRAVLMVDPFPNQLVFDRDYEEEGRDRLIRVVMEMFGALKNQARFKPDELRLAEQDLNFSRFVISPSLMDEDGRRVKMAMAADALGGFGAFFHENFRLHDFQLGRRNCQAFLKRHFVLPESNPVFGDPDEEVRLGFYVRDMENGKEVERPEFFDAKDGTRKRYLPIIPLVETAAEEVARPDWALRSGVDYEALRALVRARAKAVGETFVDTELKTYPSLTRWGLRRAWNWLGVGRTTNAAMKKIETELTRLQERPTDRPPVEKPAVAA